MITGFTVGVFDLFHFGHVFFLKEAKKLCDELIVGIHSDRTVLEYKGQLPVMSFVERLEVVEACKYVDRVMIAKMTNELSEGFYRNHKIDIHMQGDEEPGWYDLPKKLGIFKLLSGCKVFSTTEVIERVKGEKK